MFTICGNETATSYDRANNIRKMDAPRMGEVFAFDSRQAPMQHFPV